MDLEVQMTRLGFMCFLMGRVPMEPLLILIIFLCLKFTKILFHVFGKKNVLFRQGHPHSSTADPYHVRIPSGKTQPNRRRVSWNTLRSPSDEASGEVEGEKDDEDEDEDEDEFEEVEVDVKYKKVKTRDWEKVNANVAVWARDKDEITNEEYANFYKVRQYEGMCTRMCLESSIKTLFSFFTGGGGAGGAVVA